MTVYVWVGGSTWKRTKRATTEPSGLPQPALNDSGGSVRWRRCSCVKPGIGLNDPYGSFPTWNVLWFYDLCQWGMGHVTMGWAGQWGIVWSKCGWLCWLYQENKERCIFPDNAPSYASYRAGCVFMLAGSMSQCSFCTQHYSPDNCI